MFVTNSEKTDNKIVKKDDKYYVYSEDGKKKLGGPYDTEKEAEKRLKQVDYFKHKTNQLVTMKTKIEPIVRNDRMEDKDYIVVPMVMLVEGVHNGSCGALYYPADELAKTPQAWNCKPVVVYHPEGPTACDPDILTNRSIGKIMNTKWEDGKLKAEAWLEPDRMKKVDQRVADAVEKQEMLELSTGLFTDCEGPGGDWNGENYDAIAKNYRPDHLAVLPDQIGACSTKDGAGFLRLNSEIKKEKELGINDEWAKTFFPMLEAAGIDTTKLTGNELSHSTIWGQLQALIEKQSDNVDGSSRVWPYVTEVFSDHFIYEKNGKLYKHMYEVKDDAVKLTGMPEEVVRVVTYKTVSMNAKNVVNVNKGNKMDKDELIAKLICNKESGWTEQDKEILNGMNEDQLKVLVSKIPKKKIKPIIDNKEPEKIEKKEEPIENTQKDEPEKLMTADEYIKAAPAEIQNVLSEGLRAFNTEKNALIETIAKNPNNMFSKDFLATKNLDELRGLAKLAGVETKKPEIPMYNYSGQAEPVKINTDNVPLLGLPTMSFDKN